MKVLFIYSLQKAITFKKPLLGQEGIQFGISYISSVLKQNGHSTDLIVIDRRYKQNNLKLIKKRIESFNPKIICFSSVNSEFDFIKGIANQIKQIYPEIHLLGGGVHITLNPSEELLQVFNAICIGEGENPVLEYVNFVEKGESPRVVKNFWIKEGNDIFKNPVRNFNEDLDSLPFPDREIWQEWIFEKETRLTILLGRGCPYNCTYCSNHMLKKVAKGEYVRLRSADSILSEIEFLHKSFPAVDEYFLEVETIGCDMNWLSDLCKKLQQFNLTLSKKIRFGTNLRIFPKMDLQEVFNNLNQANFDSVIIGLESGNERIRKEILNRIYSNDHILNAVKIARSYHIKVGIFNMVGLPTETKAEFNETVKINQIIQPDWHSTSIYFPYQGTKLYELSKDLNLLPDEINTNDERQKAVLDLPGFSRKEIQKSFDSFHYNVYKANPNRNVLKLVVYYIMQYFGHNRFANLKLDVIRFLYFFNLYNITKRAKLFGVFQKV